MRIRFVSHACIEVEEQGEILITDPWFHSDIFNDSWSLITPPDIDQIDFSRLRHVLISHEHPDHLNFPTLRTIRERASGPVRAYYRLQKKSNVREALSNIGFEVVELTAHVEKEIAPGLSITSFPTRNDAAQVIRAGDRIILNQNDCQLVPEEVTALRRMFPRIDVLFFQFSLAGYYANADDPEGLARAKEKHLALISEYRAAFRPSIFVPYASFVRFCKESNAYMNEWAVSLDEVVAASSHGATQILWNGDQLLWDDGQRRNDENLIKWRDAIRATFKITPHPSIDESEILRAGESLVAEGMARELWPFRPPETHLEIRETGRAAAIDFRRGRVAILDRPDPARLAGRLPAGELLYFLKFPWGADTLNITACFHVVHAQRWRSLLRFRQSLYTGTEKEEYRERGAAWLIGRLAQGLWNRSRRVLFHHRN